MGQQEKKTKLTYDQAVTSLIKEYKPKGSVQYDELTDRIATPYELGAKGMDNLIQRIEDQGISVVDEDGEPQNKA